MSPSLGISPERAVDPKAYALGPHLPELALKPGDAAEAAEALAAATAQRLKVVVWGGGTRLERAIPSGGYDLALDLTGLSRIVEYDPEDLTVTAECGVTLASLGAAIAARGQELPLESPRAARATLGGTLAWNGSGPRRLRFGSPADRILGARFALADGTRARSGGKVVKNVAGHAVHRLLCGSRGGLAVILEASLKLLPAPEARVALIYGISRHALAEPSRWAGVPRLEPAFLTVLGTTAAATLPEAARIDAPFMVAVGLEDDAAWIAEQEARLTAKLGAPARRLEGEAVVTLAQALADAEDRADSRLVFTSAHQTPDALASVLDRPGADRLVCHAPAGRLHWIPAEGEDPSRLARDLLAAGYTLIERSSALILEPPISPESAIIALRERVKEALDPAGTLSRAE
jgi:FAD/FMN-containing dehydrogenase